VSEYVFALPDLGEGLAEAEIVQWLVQPGQSVTADQPIVSVETAKSVVDLPSPVAGVVTHLGGAPGDVIAVGSPLVVLDRTAAAPARRVLAAPSVRRLATERGVDLTRLIGTGPGQRITREDVLAAATTEAATVSPVKAPQPEQTPSHVQTDGRAAATGSRTPLRGIRREMAHAMARSWQIPHITEFREIDACQLLAVRDALRAAAGAPERFSVLPVLIRIIVAVLRRHRIFNATVDLERDEVVLHDSYNIGVATATEHGLVVPVLHNADQYGIFGAARRVADLAASARDGSLSPSQTRGATFTVTNFGSYGTWLGTPLIPAPQVAIAGFGRIREAVVADQGSVVVRSVLPVAVSADHRVIDGAELAAFLGSLEQFVNSPVQLLGEER